MGLELTIVSFVNLELYEKASLAKIANNNLRSYPDVFRMAFKSWWKGGGLRLTVLLLNPAYV